jgi:3-oxoacyl-[acyl-carrier protein] reductase
MIDPGLAGKVAIVTGGNHGIGAAVARALARQGVAVMIGYLRLAPTDDPGLPEQYGRARSRGAELLVEEIRCDRGQAMALEADLADPGAVMVIFDHAEQGLGPVDILINNAAAWLADTFLADERDQLGRRLHPVSAMTHDHHFLVNSRATAMLIAEFARRHRQREAAWGRIVSITTGGAAGFPGEVSYGASKNALESYTVAAAHELGAFGITANVVSPAATDTGWIDPEFAAEIARASPLRHVGAPEDVADVVTFLVSKQARAITGQKIVLR